MNMVRQGVTAHLVVSDGAAAIEFYKKALGAVETFRLPGESGKIMHAALMINGTQVFVRDDFPEYRKAQDDNTMLPPNVAGSASAAFHMDVANCDEAFNKAVAAGAKVNMPPADAFWGDRYGAIIDPFGHVWSFAHPLPNFKGPIKAP